MNRDKRHNDILSVLLLAVVLVALLSLALFGLHKAGIVNWFKQEQTEEQPDDGQAIANLLESLAEREKNGELTYVTLDSSIIKAVLATGGAGNQYLHEYTITYGNRDTPSISCSVLRLDNDFHLLEFKDGRLMREVLCVDRIAQVFDSRVGRSEVLTGVPAEYFEQNTGSVSAIDLINLIINFKTGTPVSWKLGTVQDCIVEALREESVNMARITLDYGDHKDIYMLDIDSRALYSYESYSGDVRMVRMQTTNFTYKIEGMELRSVLE